MSSASPSPPKGIKIPTPLSDNPHNTSRSKKPNPNIPVTRIKQYIKKLQKKGKKHGPVNYLSYDFIIQIAYFTLMRKYQTKCMVTHKDYNFINLNIEEEYPIENLLLINEIDEIAFNIKNCIDRGEKIICIPLAITHRGEFGQHVNMLIYRPYQKTIERFEPQWIPPHMSTFQYFVNNNKVDKVIKELFEIHMRIHLDKFTPKYISPEFICPVDYKGFQTIEESFFTEENKTIGFCGMWSLFVMEMMFLNPDMSTSEVMDTSIKFTRSNPIYLKNIIRGYVVELEKLLNAYIKEIDPISSGFKFSDSDTIEYMFHKIPEIRRQIKEFVDKTQKKIQKKGGKTRKGIKHKKELISILTD